MKTTILIFIACMFCFCGFSQNGQPASEIFDAALVKAKKEKKNIFIIFTATWCGPCQYLKRAIYDEYNVGFFEKNYVIIELYNAEVASKKSLENKGANSILAKYNGDSTAVPYVLILNATGVKLYGELGFSNYPDTLSNFMKVLKRTSRLDAFDLEMILERFKQVGRMVPRSD